MVDKAREVALKTLYRINNEGAYSNIALDEEISKNAQKLNAKDRRQYILRPFLIPPELKRRALDADDMVFRRNALRQMFFRRESSMLV